MAEPLRLGLKGLEEVLLAVAGVAPTDAATKAFRSRLGHLQRSGFPAAARVGRFVRAAYGLDELLQLAVVFSLVQAYVPPVVGRRIVLEFWPEVARLLLAALPQAGIPLDRVPAGAPLVMTIVPEAMRNLGDGERGGGRGGVDQGGYEVLLHRARWVDGGVSGGPAEPASASAAVATITLDFQVLAARLIDALGESRRPSLEAAAWDLADRCGWP